MKGHVGADHVEYVLRHQRKLQPMQTIRLGNKSLDHIELSPAELSQYDIESFSK